MRRSAFLSAVLLLALPILAGGNALALAAAPSAQQELRMEVVEAWGFGESQIVLNERLSANRWKEEIAWCRDFGDGALADFPIGQSCDLGDYRGDITILFSQLYAPICEKKEEIFCLESASVINSNGLRTKAEFVRYTHPEKSVPASKWLGSPRGESSSVWRFPGVLHSGGSDLYEVSVLLSSSAQQVGGKVIRKLDFSQAEYQFSIRPFIEKPYEECGHGWIEQCLSMPEAASFELVALAQKTKRNWFAGRILEPEVTFSDVKGSTIRISIAGESLETPVFQEVISAASASPGLRKSFEFCKPTQSICHGATTPLNANGQWEWLEAWKGPLQDSLTKTKHSWNMRSLLVDPRKFNYWRFQKCAPDNAPAGVLTTNALVFDGQMPQLRAGYFNFKTAGLHTRPDGVTPFLGYYEVTMNRDLVTCLLKLPKVPISAEVSVRDENNQPVIATKVVGSNVDSIEIQANNFSFSEKQIRFKITSKGYRLCTKGSDQTYVKGSRCPGGFKG